MKIYILTLLLGGSIYGFGQGQQCQQDLFPKQSKNRYWGYVNIFDQWQITPIFTTAAPFRGKTAVVLRRSRYGAVNCDGRLIIPCEYEEIKDFVGGKAWVRKEGLWGLINDEGRMLLYPRFSEVKEISKYSDQVWLKSEQTWGVYDLDKETCVYDPQFEEVQVLDATTSLVKKEGQSGIVKVDENKIVYPFQMDKVVKVAPYRLAVKENNHWGMVTYHGRRLVEPTYDTLFFKYKNLIQVEKDNKKGLVNYKGRVVTPVEFDTIANFYQGGAKIISGNKSGFISARGQLVIPLEYQYADRFANKVCIAKREEGYGLLNSKNEWVVKDTFDLIEPATNYGYYVAHDGKDRYYINAQSEIDFTKGFLYIDLECESALTRISTGEYFLYDFDAKKYVTSKGLDSIGKQNKNVFLFKEENKWGILDTAGRIKVKNVYQQIVIENKKNQCFLVKANEKWGMRTLSKELIPIQFEELRFLDKNYLFVKEDQQGVFSVSGKEVVAPVYDSLQVVIEEDNLNWPIIYKKKKKVGLVSSKGDELKTPKTKKLRYLNNGLYGYKSKEIWGVLNKKGEILIEPQYEDLGEYKDGVLLVKSSGKWLSVSKKGKVLKK